jgi:hypothetical protein
MPIEVIPIPQPSHTEKFIGSGTYTSIRAALVERLTTLDSQKDIALSTDMDA